MDDAGRAEVLARSLESILGGCIGHFTEQMIAKTSANVMVSAKEFMLSEFAKEREGFEARLVAAEEAIAGMKATLHAFRPRTAEDLKRYKDVLRKGDAFVVEDEVEAEATLSAVPPSALPARPSAAAAAAAAASGPPTVARRTPLETTARRPPTTAPATATATAPPAAARRQPAAVASASRQPADVASTRRQPADVASASRQPADVASAPRQPADVARSPPSIPSAAAMTPEKQSGPPKKQKRQRDFFL